MVCYWNHEYFGSQKHNTCKSREVSLFPAGDHKATRNELDSMTDQHETQITKRIHEGSTASEQSVKINFIRGLNYV